MQNIKEQFTLFFMENGTTFLVVIVSYYKKLNHHTLTLVTLTQNEVQEKVEEDEYVSVRFV